LQTHYFCAFTPLLFPYPELNMSEKHDPLAEEAEVVHDLKAQAADESTRMPEDIAALSEDEREKLGKRATLKMDIVVMPVLVIMYILNYLDRQNIASAKLAGIDTDLGLSAVEYQTSVSILFCSYSKFRQADNRSLPQIPLVRS
jgi:hypothetical protein